MGTRKRATGAKVEFLGCPTHPGPCPLRPWGFPQGHSRGWGAGPFGKVLAWRLLRSQFLRLMVNLQLKRKNNLTQAGQLLIVVVGGGGGGGVCGQRSPPSSAHKLVSHWGAGGGAVTRPPLCSRSPRVKWMDVRTPPPIHTLARSPGTSMLTICHVSLGRR